MYFETKVRYDKIHENGTVKAVTEPYLVDALTCTEAEARITEKLQPYISGDFSVTSVKQSKISEAMFGNGDYYYIVKCDYPTIDEKTATEKSNIISTLVQASSLLDAEAKYALVMHDSVADWEYVSIALTPIVDVFRYEAPSANAESPQSESIAE